MSISRSFQSIAVAILSIIAIAITTISVSVYGYPVSRIDNIVIDVYSINTYISIDTSRFGYYVYGYVNVVSDGRYLYFSITQYGETNRRHISNLLLIKYDPKTSRVVYNTTIAFPQETFEAGIQYFGGYIYIFYYRDHSIVEVRNADNLNVVVARYNLTSILNSTATQIYGVRRERDRIIVYGNVDNMPFIGIINGTSLEKIRIYNDLADIILEYVVFNGSHYLGVAQNLATLGYMYIVFDKDLNIVDSKSLDRRVYAFDIWSNGVVFDSYVNGLEYIEVRDWSFNPVKIYDISQIVNTTDYVVDYLDVVNDVVVAVVDTDYTNYYPRIVMFIDPYTDKIETYVLKGAISYPMFTNWWGFHDPSNILLYPAYYEVDDTRAYLSAVAVSISTPSVATQSTVTTTVVQPVPVYQTITSYVTVTTVARTAPADPASMLDSFQGSLLPAILGTTVALMMVIVAFYVIDKMTKVSL